MDLPFEHYLVGGAVRDELLGREVVDRDWVIIGATVRKLRRLGFRQVGKDFPVFLHPETKDEYALARTERKSGQGHTGFAVHADPDVTLEEDLARRDLTINAMARSPDGEIIDPFGGLADLKARLLRHVSPAFSEDPLRVFRLARLAAQLEGFTVAQETRLLMDDMCRRGELRTLSAERVWIELLKALRAPAPMRFFEVLSECSGLEDWFEGVDIERLFFSSTGTESGQNEFLHYIELMNAARDVAALALKLKVPRAYRQVYHDWQTNAETLMQWRTVASSALAETFALLKVGHGLARLESTLAVIPEVTDPEQLLAMAAEFAQIEIDAEGLKGKAYGEAKRRAEEAWLAGAR